ncbi:MAG: Ig-like domain-containing protein [Clostridia bacterium]|nr:Ig-like domain-containing protein [Clostridia bacterium]
MKKNVKQILSRIAASFLAMTVVMGTVTVPIGSAVSLSEIIIDENFDSMQTGVIPEGFEASGDGGTATVGSYMNKTGVAIKNESEGKYVMLSKSFDTITNGVFDLSFNFLQPQTASEAVILSLYNAEGSEFVKLTTNNGAVYLENSGTNELVIPSYQVDRWYGFHLLVNTVTGLCEVFVDGNLKLETTVTNASSTLNKVGFYTVYSPGFYIDDLHLVKNTNTDRLVIEGPQFVSVPKYGANEYKIKACMKDGNNTSLTETPIAWEIVNNNGADLTGVDFVVSDDYGMEGTLIITSDAMYRGIVELKSTYTGEGSEQGAPTASHYVTLMDETIQSLEITGAPRIKNGLTRKERTYEVIATDNLDKTINRVDTTWYLGDGAPSYVSIDDDGVLQVSDTIEKDVHIEICVKADGASEPAKKTVILQTAENYDDDVFRLDIYKKSMDTLIKLYSDPYSKSPLLLSYLDVRTMKPLEWQQVLGQPTLAQSNLATDSMVYRCMDYLSEFTGDPKYKERVDAVYQWHLDYGLSENFMGYWGGHAAINLKDLKPILAPMNYNTHEFKEHYMYWDPFYRLDPEAGYKLCRNVVLAHITDWQYMLSNRHASYSKELDTSMWTNLDAFANDYGIIPTTKEQPFKNMGCDMEHAAGSIVRFTGDEYAREWGLRIFKMYAEAANPVTNIMPSVYTTGKDAEGVKDPDVEFANTFYPYKWYEIDDIDEAYTTVAYGDRFVNQFGEDLVAQGFYDESVLEPGNVTLAEGYYKNSFQTNYMISDLGFAKELGTDTPEGRYIVEKVVKMIEGYLDYAWIKGSNKFRYIMADGTDISDFVPNRSGYYGNYYNRGEKLGHYTVGSSNVEGCIMAYLEAKKRDDLQVQAEKIYEFINFMAEEVLDWGKLGGEEIGDEDMELNYATTDSAYTSVLSLTELYYATGNMEFLDLARVVANNFIKSHYKWGMLISNTSASSSPGSQYVLTLLNGAKYYYALAFLEGAIRGDEDLVQHVRIMGSGYHDQMVFENGETKRDYDGTNFAKMTSPSIFVQDIVFEEESINLKKGEKTTPKYSVLPKDASNKSVTFWITNNNVATLNRVTGEITAVSPGTTELIAISGDLKVNKTLTITVK